MKITGTTLTSLESAIIANPTEHFYIKFPITALPKTTLYVLNPSHAAVEMSKQGLSYLSHYLNLNPKFMCQLLDMGLQTEILDKLNTYGSSAMHLTAAVMNSKLVGVSRQFQPLNHSLVLREISRIKFPLVHYSLDLMKLQTDFIVDTNYRGIGTHLVKRITNGHSGHVSFRVEWGVCFGEYEAELFVPIISEKPIRHTNISRKISKIQDLCWITRPSFPVNFSFSELDAVPVATAMAFLHKQAKSKSQYRIIQLIEDDKHVSTAHIVGRMGEFAMHKNYKLGALRLISVLVKGILWKSLLS